MSAKGLEALWARTMDDDEFSRLLFTNPDQALVEYDITREGAAMFKTGGWEDQADASFLLVETSKSFS